MIYEWINRAVEETNLVIKYALKNKVFLIFSMIAVIVVLFSLLFKLNKLEWAIILITISISITTALEYSYAHNNHLQQRKMMIGSILLFHTFIAMIIGLIIFYDKTIQNPHYALERISANDNLIFSICLIVPIVITIFSKIILSSGEPLYGGIISGHGAFTATLFIINYHAKTPYLLLIIPIISILLPRCFEIKNWIKGILKALGVFNMIILCVYTIINNKHFILTLANVLMFILVLICQGKPVHKKFEICMGITLGTICSIVTLLIFK